MEEKNNVTIHISIEPNIVNVPYTTATNAEEICTNICKQLNLLPVSRPLFALRIQNSQGCKVWLPANSKLLHGNKYEFRMRFKVSSLNNLLSLDKNAYDYYFHQTRKDVLENQIPEIVYAKHKSELLGLGVVDMYRDMIEHKIPAEEIEKNYKRYIPKEISKKHSIFTKKPIHISLGILRKQTPDIWFVKNEYLKQVDSLAPNYLAEEYTAMTDLGCGSCLVNIMVAPYHAEQPGVRVCYDNKEWQHLCTVDDLCFISIRTDSTVEISRRNGIPSYLKFNTVHHMLSFVSILDGYYRLSVKWTFNLCKDVPTPSLKALNSMKCHGPVGGEFSYAKLEEKRNNKHGCYIIRECKQDFHTYFIDVCTKSEKPETYKVSIIGNEWIMHSNSSKYESLTHLISSHKDSLESPYLSECLPPSEYDKSPLLLCEPVVTAADSKACISDVEGLLRAPHCINPRDIQYFKRCKVSHLGIEFSDLISVSGAGLRCQRWFSEKPIHPISKDIKDLDFPERSINLANNYCRNPLRRTKGPWCYTMDPMVIDDSCDIPLCRNLLCRVTGPGMDYSGKQIKTVSDRTCKSWKWWMSRTKKLKTVNGTGQAVVFDDWLFPENSRSNANNFCRNPDGDIGGPWCYVESEDGDNLWEKDFCDIPFCDDKDCMVFTKNSVPVPFYSQYTFLNSSLRNLSFSVKIWNPDDCLFAEARIVLSVFALPVTSQQINDFEIGLEIIISNNGSVLNAGSMEEEIIPEDTPQILNSKTFTNIWLSWGGGFLSMGIEGVAKPILISEYKETNNSMSFESGEFLYYSLLGSNILWSFPFCDDENFCDVHVTFNDDFPRFYQIEKANSTRDIRFFVRGHDSAMLRFKHSPAVLYPRVTIMLGIEGTKTRIILENKKDGGQILLQEVPTINIINYWTFREFSLSIFGDQLQLFWLRSIGTQTVIEVAHEELRKLRWFSPGSLQTEIHWSFYCKPDTTFHIKPAYPPECSVTQAEIGYVGTQAVTREGQPCLPWIASVIPAEYRIDSKFVDLSVLKARNYCRNLNRDSNGPFCIALDLKSNKNIGKKYCKVRDCQSAECRMAGTGNDYIGKLNVTRSNRTCQLWVNGTIHSVDQQWLNEALYADRNLSQIENFCRDPSRNVAGPWCYTNDPVVPMDLCNVPDCSKDEECIILATGTTKGRYIYILPSWKETGPDSGLHFSLKEWNPDLQDGIIFEICSKDKNKYFELFLGAENNEKVLLTYTFDFNQTITLKEKTLPHLIPSGKWGNFWLQVPKGSIRLGYEGSPYALFEWDSRRSTALIESPFEPIFLSYRPILGNTIGISFSCRECHTENTTSQEFSKIIPIKVWRPKVKSSGLNDEAIDFNHHNNLTLYIRGSGVVLIPLILLPFSTLYYSIVVGDFGNSISIVRNSKPLSVTLAYKLMEESVIFPDKWTLFNIIFNETTTSVLRNNTEIVNYTSTSPMLKYWFSIGVQSGWATWIANSFPPDIDGPPLDGGWGSWSPWKCTVSCGGGAGVRTRKCNNPEPNVFGKLCSGPHSSTGKCNEFECGDISPNTEEEITKTLQREYHSYTVKEYEDIDIKKPKELVANITRESPKAKFKWTLNGLYMKMNKTNSSRIEINEESLRIKNASVSDSGIYLLMLYRITNHKHIIKVVSITVETQTPTIITRVSYDIMLKCHGVVLGTKKDSEEGMICVYRAMWKVARGKKVEVAMKVLKSEAANDHIKEFTDLAGKWAFLESSSIVRLYGVTLGSPISMVMEYHSMGPLDQYLRENQDLIQVADLVEAGSQLATALWTLQENGFVHGNIRCHKILVSSHDENSLVVRLTDPGLHSTYSGKDVHWIPPECYSNLEFAHKAPGADVWAFGTTLWEIFSNGKSPNKVNLNDTKRYYVNGKRLPQPEECPSDIYNLMRDCWDIDPHRRRKPQEIMRDLNQILYQVFNSRRTHSYSTVFPKTFKENSKFNGSASSLFSNATDETFLVRDCFSASDMERDSNTSLSSGFSGGSSQQGLDINASEDLCSSGSGYSISEMSAIWSNLNITQTTSLDSMHSVQCIFEVSADCNLVLQGRIGQGFYGEVYRGTLERVDKDTEPKLVAIKKLKTNALSSCMQDFEREINIMMSLKHPNIVEILCALDDPDISLVMEFVQHGSLQSYLKINRDTITISHLLKYSLDIADGMKYLGQKKIVHRDLAARNILVANEHHVKISDFGLAQVTEKGEYYILKTNRDLPIKWYAPESLRDGKFSTRSDVWSYGVTMFEMFSRGDDPKLLILPGSPTDDAEPLKMLKALEHGIRLRQPDMCPSIIYSKLMAPCWEFQPSNRPTFLQLGLDVTELLKQC